MKSLTAGVLMVLALSGCSVSSQTASRFGGCNDFTSAADAQRAWQDAGRPGRYDGDQDGRVCESLRNDSPSVAKTRDCVRTGQVARISISSTRYPNVLAHIDQAVAAGHPRILTLDRPGADSNRAQSLDGVPTRPGYDRDEWPMAVSAEGGRGAHIKYVPSAENRGAGSVVGVKLRRYCDGQRFTVIGY